MRVKPFAAALIAALVLSACAGAADPEEPEVAPEQRAPAEAGVGDPSASPTKASPHRREKDDGEEAGVVTVPPPSPTQQASAEEEQAAAAPAAPRERRARLFPAPGRYVFAQDGYEKFCGTATCQRESLPARGSAEIRVTGRSGGRATIELENRMSDHVMSRATLAYSRDEALVTEVFFRFSYRGLSYSDRYSPRPAVRSLRFPLRPGTRWSGRWEAETSGSYRAGVAGVETVRAGSRRVRAAKVVTSTSFTGEFEGRADLVAWVDPDTRAVVASRGSIDVTSVFGRYVSEFETRLRSGPGY